MAEFLNLFDVKKMGKCLGLGSSLWVERLRYGELLCWWCYLKLFLLISMSPIFIGFFSYCVRIIFSRFTSLISDNYNIASLTRMIDDNVTLLRYLLNSNFPKMK